MATCPKCGSQMVAFSTKSMCLVCGYTSVPDLSPPREVDNRGMYTQDNDTPPGVSDLERSTLAWITPRES